MDELWQKYDADGSGTLEKPEARRFINDTMKNLGSNDSFTEETYDEVFAEFDEDKTGKISKQNMISFMRKIAGV